MIKCVLAYCNYRQCPGTAYYCELALRRLLGDSAVLTLGNNNDLHVDDGHNPYPVLHDAVLSGKVDLDPDAFLLEVESGGFDLGWVPVNLPMKTAWWAIDSHISLSHHCARAPHYNQVFIAQRAYLDAVKEKNANTEWLLLACDRNIHDGLQYNADPSVPPADIVFVGNMHPSVHGRRIRLVKNLQSAGVRVAVHNGLWLDAVTKMYTSYPFVLNCSLNGDINMRYFEAMASGTPTIQDELPHASGVSQLHRTWVRNLVGYYRGEDDVNTIKALLSDDKIIEAGPIAREWVLANHTYDHRMRQVCERMGVL